MKLQHWIALGFLAVAVARLVEYHAAHRPRGYQHCPHEVADCHAWIRSHGGDAAEDRRNSVLESQP